MKRAPVLCAECGAPVSKDLVALNKKTIRRDVPTFLCAPCLAEVLGCCVDDLAVLIEDFKEQGCALFG